MSSGMLVGVLVGALAVSVACWNDSLLDLVNFVKLPPSDVMIRKAEHWVFIMFAIHIAMGVWGLVKLGPAKAWKKIVGTIFGRLQAIPGFDGLLEKGLEKELVELRSQLLGDGDADAVHSIPAKGLPRQDIITKLKAAKGASKAIGSGSDGGSAGKAWGGIYHEEGSDLTTVQNEAWALFNCSNTLYPGTYPGVRKFEAEIISMVLGLVHGHEVGAVGLLTSGGTESIMVAVLSYREQWRKTHGHTPEGETPEIICGLSAHPALTKACHYFGVKQVKLPLDPRTMALDPEAVALAIGPNTVAVYASAPTFTHGVVDPISVLGPLCEARGVGLHVDNCLGGFLLSFMAKRGHFTPSWDFDVKGVTSMSVDVHKYGYASKGVSVVGFRDPALRRAGYHPSVDGCEGLYVTPTLQGSRSGATIAQAWATLLATGAQGYERMADQQAELTAKVMRAVQGIDELELLVTPHAAIVPIVAKKGSGVEIYQVASVLESKGWNMFTGQHPPVMSVCLGEQHLKMIEHLIADLAGAVEHVKKNPSMKLEGQCAVYGAAAAIPDELLDSILRSYCDIRMEVKDKKKPEA